LAALLGLEHHQFAGALRDEQGGAFGIALLARWPLETPQIQKLPRERDEQRVLLSAQLLAPEGAVQIFNTHLSIFEPERLEQAAWIRERLRSQTGPLILMGDLNDEPESACLKHFGGLDLLDCFDQAGEGPEETFSVLSPTRRLDYIILGGGLKPIGARVLRAAHASDHFPLLAELRRP